MTDKRQPEPSEATDLRHEADMLDSMAVNRRNMHTTALRLREITDAIDRPRLEVSEQMVERAAKHNWEQRRAYITVLVEWEKADEANKTAERNLARATLAAAGGERD